MANRNLRKVDTEDISKDLKEYLEVPVAPFKPSLDMIKFKEEVYDASAEKKLDNLSIRNLAKLTEVSKSTVHRWMAIPGFREWLSDPRSSKDLGRAMVADVIREAYEVAMNGEGTAKTNAMRMLLEFYEQKEVSRTRNENIDLSDLSEEELDDELNSLMGKKTNE